LQAQRRDDPVAVVFRHLREFPLRDYLFPGEDPLDADLMQELDAGVHAIGQNYVSELRAVRAELTDVPIRWHYIGVLQSGTAHHVAGLADVVETVAGERAARMLDLSGPTPDFTQLSEGLGVPARRVTTTAELDRALRLAYAEPGPHLIEAIVPPAVPPTSGTAW
jgi:hypothetical protein